MWRAPPRGPWARARCSPTAKPAVRGRRTKLVSGAADQTASTPPGRSAARAALRPAESYSRSFAARLVAAESADDGAAVHRGYLTALGRPPSDAELADALEFLKQQSDAYAADGKPDGRALALADFCQVLMGLNEFVYVE